MADARDIFLNQVGQGSDLGPLTIPILEKKPEISIPSELTSGGTIGGGLTAADIEESALPAPTGRQPAEQGQDARDAFLIQAGVDPRESFLESTKQGVAQVGEGAGDTLIKVLSAAGDFIERFSAAPSRSATRAGLRAETPFQAAFDIPKAFGGQFLQDPALAPTGKQIASEDLGFSTEQTEIPIRETVESIAGPLGIDKETTKGIPSFSASPAGAVGLGIDVFDDLFGFVPVGPAIKGAGKLAKGVATFGLKKSARVADLLAGTDKITETGKVVGRSIDDVTESFVRLFDTEVAGDFEELKNIARKNNIDEDLLVEAAPSVEFKKDSFVDVASRQRRELGGKDRAQFDEVVEQITEAIDSKIKKIGQTDEVMDAEEAGGFLKEAYDRGVKEFFDSIGATHNKIIKQNPGLQLTDNGVDNLEETLGKIQKLAEEDVALGADRATRSQGKGILQNIEMISKTVENRSYKDSVKVLRQIGKTAYKSTNKFDPLAPDVEKMRDLYQAFNKSLIDAAENGGAVLRRDTKLGEAIPLIDTGAAKDLLKTSKLREEVITGGDLANDLILSNTRMTELFGDKSVLKKIGDKNAANEDIFRNLVTKGNSKKAGALRSVLTESDFNKIKAAYLQDVIKKGIKEDVKFQTVIKDMRKNKHVISELLTPTERDEYLELLKLGDRVGIPVLSTSGTGPSRELSKLRTLIVNVTSNDVLVENLKRFARNKKQVETIGRLTENATVKEARAIIKRAKLPKKVERAAINKFRKLKLPLKKPKPIIKIPQVISVQERQIESEKKE